MAERARCSIGVVKGWAPVEAEGAAAPLQAASLSKPVLSHLALSVFEDLDEPFAGDITIRHVLSHTTGYPNWRADGEKLVPLRPPGQRWGYSGEAFVLLTDEMERRTGHDIDDLARQHIFGPLGMAATRFDEPGSQRHRPMFTTAADYGRFLAHVLAIHDERWVPQVDIDHELAWGAGWGLEVGPPRYGWQWGLDSGVSHFVIGCPDTGDGVVVLTEDPNGRGYYRGVVERVLPGDHPSLRVERNPTWLKLVT